MSFWSAYRKILGRIDFGAHNIQAALETLRDRNLIWKSARGAYALEDASMASTESVLGLFLSLYGNRIDIISCRLLFHRHAHHLV